MSFLNRTKKIFVFSILVNIIIISLPQTSRAQLPVMDVIVEANTAASVATGATTATMTTLEKVKHYVLDPIAWVVAKRIVNGLTNQTVNWINSGFDGNPAYITNPSQFFLDLGDTAASAFLSGTKMNLLCTPFKAEVRLALVRGHLSENNNFSCTLSAVKNNYDEFMQDFSKGGWAGWFEITQSDANNPYGAYLNAQSSLISTILAQNSKYAKQIEQGRGFLSYEQCPKTGVVTQENIDANNALVASGALKPENNALDGKKAGDCLVEKETVTPGSVIETQLQGALGTGIRQLELADSFNEIITAAVTQLYSKVVAGNGKGGLRGLGSSSSGSTQTNPYAPTITLIGGKTLYVQVGIRFDDPGAIATDPIEGDITEYMQITGQVDTTTVGTYLITYTVVNSDGLPATPVIRTVYVVVDAGAPTGICSAISTGRGNDPGAPSTISLSEVNFKQAEVAGWKQTGTLSGVNADNSTIRFTYTTPSWNALNVGTNSSTIGSAWVLVWRKVTFPQIRLDAVSLGYMDDLRKELIPIPTQADTYSKGLLGLSSQATAGQINMAISAYSKPIINLRSRMNLTTTAVTSTQALNYISTAEGALRTEIDNLESIIQLGAQSKIDSDVRATAIKVSRSLASISVLSNNLLAKVNDVIAIANGTVKTGEWQAIPFTYLTTTKNNDIDVGTIFCGDQNFKPTAGDTYGFMISTPANNSDPKNQKERTNIATYVWPTGIVRAAPPQTPRSPTIPSGGTSGGGFSAPTDALTQHPDQSGSIAQAKADLIAQGVNLSGACGAWEIIRLGAKYMGGGAGLLNKSGGNMCNGYATDIIAYPDGYIYDVLIDGGGLNTPTWNPTACPGGSTCPSEYRTAP